MIFRWLNHFSTREERPRPRAWKRFMTWDRPTSTRDTTSWSTSNWWLFSALAIALSNVFFTVCAMRRLLKVSVATASAAVRPRISPAARLSLRGEARMFRVIACASVAGRVRSCFGLLIGSASLRLLVGGVPREGARRRELAELVADHVLRDLHRDELLPVVDPEGQADELRQDRAAARPDLDDLVARRSPGGLRLGKQVAVDKRPLPYAARHRDQPFVAWRRRTMRPSVRLLLRVFAPLVGLPHGVTG